MRWAHDSQEVWCSCHSDLQAVWKEEKFKISVFSENKKSKIIVLDEKSKIDILPKTDTQCPKCENREAYWWMQQMRAADEPPTRFFKCTKCGNVWREYE